MPRKKRKRTKAQLADPYDLYQRAVQAPEHEVSFFNRVYKRAHGRPPCVLREDFCGTFAVSCQWVASRKDRIALGVDIDLEPLDWGRAHNLSRLKPHQQQRVQLLQDDVRSVTGPKADIVAAQNFSFWVFKTRDELAAYFDSARQNLAGDGVFILDMMGGPESMDEDREDVTEYKEFTYIWYQARFDPITHHCRYLIHFHFRDGSKLHRCFEYNWRFWTLPEVQEVLQEVGFKRVDIYWEGTDQKTGEGNDIYRVRKHAPNELAWISYVVAVK